jgi:hypothetical protein
MTKQTIKQGVIKSPSDLQDTHSTADFYRSFISTSLKKTSYTRLLGYLRPISQLHGHGFLNLLLHLMSTSWAALNYSLALGTKVVWIISASDPIRIRIMRIWRRVFDIHADVDNPNPIVCRCGIGYGVSDIRRIWIIR